MPRRPRVFVAGASDHVYCRVARGERVFADPREAAVLVGVIREVVREHGLSVLAWCIGTIGTTSTLIDTIVSG